MASNETNNTEDAVNRAYMALDKPVSSKERLDDKDDTWAVDMAKLGGIDVKERGHLGNLVSASGIVNLASASGRIGMGGKQDHKHKKGGGGRKGKVGAGISGTRKRKRWEVGEYLRGSKHVKFTDWSALVTLHHVKVRFTKPKQLWCLAFSRRVMK